MKWLGQYIQDLTARFRDDVYLENISSGTIASGGNLGLDSNNKVVKQSDTGITDLHGAGVDGSDNQVLTDDGDGTVTSEANLTFDGTTLTTTGKSAISAGSAVGGPALTITQADADQHGISIDATALTAAGSADAIFIDATNSVSPIHVDQDIGATSSISHNGAFFGNVTKASNTTSGQTCHMFGAQFIATDTGDNVGTVNATGLEILSNITNNTGTTTVHGIHNRQTGSADTMVGFLSEVPLASPDIKMISFDSGGDDYFSVNVGETGSSDLTTVHGTGATAHLTFNVDGTTYFKNYTGLSTRFSITGNDSDYFDIAVGNNGNTTLTTVDAAATAAHFEIAADGNITLDAAADIALEAAGNDVTVDADTLTVTSSTADYPQIKMLNTTDDDQGCQLLFEKLRADDGVATGQNLGEIWFRGQDNGQNTEDYAHMIAKIDVSTHGQESGQLNLGVCSHNGTSQNGIEIVGGSVAGEVDVTIGRGAASVTTVAGNLEVTNNLTVTESIRGKSIYVETCNFSDNLGTTEHFIPFVTSSESTAFSNVATPWIAPVAGKLLKVHWRSSQHCNVSSNEMSFRLYKISDGTRWSGTNESLLGTKVVTGPARTTHVIADFQSGLESGAGSETNAFAANDLLGVSIQHSQAQGTTEKVTVTLVFELDFSSY
jgi:hypothetical protein